MVFEQSLHTAERQGAMHISREKVYANGYSDCAAAQRTDRQNRCLRNAGNGEAQNAENCYLLPICRLSRNTADRKRMGILPSRHKTGCCG